MEQVATPIYDELVDEIFKGITAANTDEPAEAETADHRHREAS